MKKLLLTLLCLSGMLSMSAVTVYMDRIGAAIIESGENGYSSDGFTFTALKNNGSTAPAYNATGKDLRIYAKGSFTIASETPITQLYFAISAQGKNRMAPITASTGTIEAQTVAPDFLVWKGEAKEVTFTVGDKAVYGLDGEAKAGQFDFLDIVINEEVTEEPTPDPEPDPDPVVTDAVENIEAWLNAADSSKEIAISSPATAVFQSGRNLYIKDETGWLLVYGDVNQTYTNGMTIPAGYAGTFKDYNGLPEMVANAGTFQTGTAGTPVAPMQTSIPRATTLPLNSYIKIENVTLSAPNGKNQTASDDSDNELNLYNSLNINLPAAGSGYTIIGFLAIYNGTYQLTPVEITSESGPVDPDPDPIVTDANDIWFVAPGFTGYPADANVVVLHNQSGNDSATADDAQNPDFGLYGKTFGNDKVSISFNIHGTNDYYTTAFNDLIRWYKNEGITITAADKLYVNKIYVATAAYSKGNFTVTQDGKEIGKVSGTGVDAENPITWTGSFQGSAEAVTAAQVRFNYMIVSVSENPGEPTPDPDPDPDPVVTDAVDNIAAWLKAADTSKDIAISTPATAVHQNGRSLYIKDETGWLLVYGDVNQTYTNGMTIPAGYAGTFKDYNGLPEMVANAGTFKAGTAGTPVAPIKTTVKDASSQPLNSYLQIENVTLSTADGKNQTATDASGNELKLYNSLYIDLPAAGSGYTVTGFLAIYNGTYQLTPVEITNGTGGGGGDQPVADENVTWFVAPGFTGYPADANVVVLHNQSGNDSPTTDEVTENAIDPSYGLFDKSFGNEKVAINFNIHGTNDFYPVAVGQQVRWYKNEGLTITAGEDLYVTEIYVATAAYSKGKFNLTQNGNEIGTVSGTGLDAANPITWTGAFKGSAEAVSEAQIRFNYITVRTADAASVNVVNTEVLSQPVRYYNLQGQEVKNPTNGLYIRVQGDRSSKVLVK